MIATGGSEITRRILPVIGFRPPVSCAAFARPLRPLRQACTTPRNLETPGAIARNSLLAPLAAAVASARMVGAAAGPGRRSPGSVASSLHRRRRSPRGTPASTGISWILPRLGTRCSAWRRRGELVGYFCLAFAPHVARIADLWLPSTNVEDWCAGFRAAAVAAREQGVYEVPAWASTALGKEALRRAPASGCASARR